MVPTSYINTLAPSHAPGKGYQPTNNNVDIVMKAGFPVELMSMQKYSVCALGDEPRIGLYYDVGSGKTLTSLAIALLKIIRGEISNVLILLPPVLAVNWQRNIERIPNTQSVIYAGTPKQRRDIDLTTQFAIASLPIFKRDYPRFEEAYTHRDTLVIVDESQSLKNPGTDNFRKVRDFTADKQICLLSGTPISVPEDAYASVKLVTPGIYRTQYQFESIHVTKRDFLSNKPLEYANLDILSKNLMLKAHRVLKEDILDELPEIAFVPVFYDLDPKHYKLYAQLAEEQLVVKASGEKLDLTNVSALYQALQQVPCNAEHFSEGEVESTVLGVVDEVLDELGQQKLVIFCHYRMTTQRLLAHCAPHNAVALWGGTEASKRQLVIDTFVNDPDCRVLILNYKSGGAGIDNLQHVCSNMLAVELPYRATDMRQAAARLHRMGQMQGVTMRLAIANGTLQVRCWEFLQDNDSLVNSVLRGPKDLRDAVFGR